MAGKRINNPSLTPTDFSTAIANTGKILTDWEGIGAEAQTLLVSLLGNGYIQGSTDGATWSDQILDTHLYLRFSTDGGTTWLVFPIGDIVDTITDSHIALSLGSPTSGLALDASNQILTLSLATTSLAGALSAADKTKIDILETTGSELDVLVASGEYLTLNSEHSGLTITHDEVNDELDFTLVESAIDHDSLLNWVANDHIDHSTVNIDTTNGISGGGDLTTTRTLTLDITGLTAIGTLDPDADYLAVYDTDLTTNKKVLASEVGEIITNANVGTGEGLYVGKSVLEHQWKTLIAGSGVTFTSTATALQIDATGTSSGETNLGTNLGTGIGVYDSKSGVNLQFRSLISNHTGLTVALDSTEIDFNLVEANINHDILNNYVSNEHIDHSTVSITGTGALSGGGDITTSSTIDIDISGLSEQTTVLDTDLMLIYDGANNKYVQISSLPTTAIWGAITGTLSNQTDLQNELDAKVPITRSVTTSEGITGGGVLLSDLSLTLDIPGLTEQVAIDTANDYLVMYDNSLTGHRKIAIEDLPISSIYAPIWGTLTGTLTDQTDLNTALGLKVDETITLTAGIGLSGGGDLSTNRTVNLDINELTNVTPLGEDYIAFYKTTGSTHRKGLISALPYPVTSVFGRTGDVIATTNDYTWAQVDKTTSDIADITTRSHTSLTDIGSNTHTVIDSHIADSTIHFTEASIDHDNIINNGSNSHTTIDSHISDTTIHFIKSSISLTDLSDTKNSFDTLTDGQVLTYDTVNGWQNQNPVEGVTDHLLLSNIGTNTHTTIDSHLAIVNGNPHGVDELDILPSQTGNSSKVLTTNGTSSSWGTVATGTVTSIGTSGAITGGTITSTGTITHLTTTGYKHIPSGGTTNQYLKWSAEGTAGWDTLTASEISDFDTEVANNSAVTLNTAKNTNVPTSLSTGTVTSTTYGITSDGATNDVVLASATTTLAGLLSASRYNNITTNNAKVSNATHTGEVTGSTALTITNNAVTNAKIADDAVGIDELSATGTASSLTYLRGDNTWSTINTGGDVYKVNTPANNQLGVWTGNGTIEGDTDLTWDGDELIATTETGNAVASFIANYNDNDNIYPALNLKRYNNTSITTSVNGIGTSLDFYHSDVGTNTEYRIGRIAAVRDGQDYEGALHLMAREYTGVFEDKGIIIKSYGRINLTDYGVGNHTGTAVYNLSIDSTGNIIETSSSTSGTVTSVTAGTGMTQTGTSTINPTLNVIGGTGITANANDIQITDNGVTADQLNVSGDGATSQYLRSDGDGSFTWATPISLGTQYYIPYMNAAGTDFEYDANLLYNGSLEVGATVKIQSALSTGDLNVGSGGILNQGEYYDNSLNPGTSGQILSSTATGTAWIDANSGAGTVTQVNNGSGMNFTNFTTSGTITLGTPSTTTSTTSNGISTSSHTHALDTTGVTAGSYTSTNLTVDSKGRITSASSGSSGGTGAHSVDNGNYAWTQGAGSQYGITLGNIFDTDNSNWESGSVEVVMMLSNTTDNTITNGKNLFSWNYESGETLSVDSTILSMSGGPSIDISRDSSSHRIQITINGLSTGDAYRARLWVVNFHTDYNKD